MRAARRVLQVAGAEPPVAAAAHAVLTAGAIAQLAGLAAWRARQFTWVLRPCERLEGALGLPYPSPPWRVEPPDHLGPRPFHLLETPEGWRVEAASERRGAAAKVLEGKVAWQESVMDRLASPDRLWWRYWDGF